MVGKVKILYLPVSRWRELREIRLESLAVEPIAFGSDFSEEKDSPKKKYVDRLKEKNSIFAEVDGKLAGFVGLRQGHKKRAKHTAELGPLYVRKEFRRMGLGKKLLDFAFKKAKKKGVEKVKLWVNTANKPAVAFYKRAGFKKAGLLKKDYKINGKYYDYLVMEKWI